VLDPLVLFETESVLFPGKAVDHLFMGLHGADLFEIAIVEFNRTIGARNRQYTLNLGGHEGQIYGNSFCLNLSQKLYAPKLVSYLKQTHRLVDTACCEEAN
jgi:hypothetical protein